MGIPYLKANDRSQRVLRQNLPEHGSHEHYIEQPKSDRL